MTMPWLDMLKDQKDSTSTSLVGVYSNTISYRLHDTQHAYLRAPGCQTTSRLQQQVTLQAASAQMCSK